MIPRSNIEARLPKPLAVDSKEDLNPRLCTVLFLKYVYCFSIYQQDNYRGL